MTQMLMLRADMVRRNAFPLVSFLWLGVWLQGSEGFHIAAFLVAYIIMFLSVLEKTDGPTTCLHSPNVNSPLWVCI